MNTTTQNPTQSAAHTPTPWQQLNDNRIYVSYPSCIQKDHCSLIATVPDTHIGDRNAAFIVRACNSHAQLVAALEEIVRQTNLLPAHLTPEAVADFNAAVVVTVRNVARAALSAANE